MKHRFTLEHGVNGAGQLVGEPRQGLPLAVRVLPPCQVLLPCGMVAEQQDRRFGKGPREVREALPIFVPEVPERLPADALAHVPRRQ
jgi:hypothetical protein